MLATIVASAAGDSAEIVSRPANAATLEFWADALVAVHFAFVAFVAVGQLLILVGLLLRWKWVRNPWFRSIHLASILIVAVEAAFAYQCPLTKWENDLRDQAGLDRRGSSFTGRLFNEILFSESYDDAVVHKIHMAFGVAVLLTFVLAPPRFRRRPDPSLPQSGEPEPAKAT